MTARDRILGRIRDALGAPGPRIEVPRASRPAVAGDLVERFCRKLADVHGESALVQDLDAAGELVAARLQQRQARTLAMGGGADMQALAAALRARGFVTLAEDAATDDLLAADAGLTSAQFGIAETGTLALDDAAARARRASLLPPLHVALLRTARLRATLDEALQEAAAGGRPSHALTLITGPSRTADIELQLVVGVHGPRELLVVLLDGPA